VDDEVDCVFAGHALLAKELRVKRDVSRAAACRAIVLTL
jgi:hypothetical protein